MRWICGRTISPNHTGELTLCISGPTSCKCRCLTGILPPWLCDGRLPSTLLLGGEILVNLAVGTINSSVPKCWKITTPGRRTFSDRSYRECLQSVWAWTWRSLCHLRTSQINPVRQKASNQSSSFTAPKALMKRTLIPEKKEFKILKKGVTGSGWKVELVGFRHCRTNSTRTNVTK